MIVNDPFKTREEALKTIMGMKDDQSIILAIRLCNNIVSPGEMLNYFFGLYKKFPDDFKIVHSDTNTTLLFMGREVISFEGNIARERCFNVNNFLLYWEDLLYG